MDIYGKIKKIITSQVSTSLTDTDKVPILVNGEIQYETFQNVKNGVKSIVLQDFANNLGNVAPVNNSDVVRCYDIQGTSIHIDDITSPLDGKEIKLQVKSANVSGTTIAFGTQYQWLNTNQTLSKLEYNVYYVFKIRFSNK